MEVVSGHAKGDVDSNADTQIGDTAVVRITPDKTCSDRVVVRFFSLFFAIFRNQEYDGI